MDHSHREETLRSFAGVVPQQTTESLATSHIASGAADIVVGIDQPIVQSLMVSFTVEMRQELANSVTKHVLADQSTLSPDFDRSPRSNSRWQIAASNQPALLAVPKS